MNFPSAYAMLPLGLSEADAKLQLKVQEAEMNKSLWSGAKSNFLSLSPCISFAIRKFCSPEN
jgi:hypothetical protein